MIVPSLDCASLMSKYQVALSPYRDYTDLLSKEEKEHALSRELAIYREMIDMDTDPDYTPSLLELFLT